MPPEEKKPQAKTVMIVAGEASGDMHGAALVRQMLKMDSSLQFYGIGGIRLKEAGVELTADAAEMAVVGLTEVFSKLGKILKIMNLMKKSMDERKPNLVVLIDYPDFNLPLARAARRRGIRVFYYISPQVWAWRQGRIEQIKKSVDKMAVILPFEVETYKKRGFNVEYVGHPLLDLVGTHYSRTESRNKFDLAADRTTIALLPGSRPSEVHKLLPEMREAAQILAQKIPDIQFILPLADTLDEKIVTEIISGTSVKIKVVKGGTYEAVSCADLAVVASGTATLETALLGIPMIIIYKISPFSYFIGRLAVSVKNIGLVNIIAGKTVVPELIQNQASAANIAREAFAILENDQKRREIIGELAKIRAKLGEPGAAIRAAKLAFDML